MVVISRNKLILQIFFMASYMSSSVPCQKPTVPDKNSWALPLNAAFSLLACLFVLPMLVIAVNSPNLAHQHLEGKKTTKCPNNFD